MYGKRSERRTLKNFPAVKYRRHALQSATRDGTIKRTGSEIPVPERCIVQKLLNGKVDGKSNKIKGDKNEQHAR